MSHIKNEIMGRNLLIVFLCLLAACPMLMAPFGAGVPELALLLIIGMQVLCGWLFARIARVVGKSFGLYFVLGIFPIINFIALILLGNKPTISDEKYREERRKREGEEASRNRATEEAKVTQRPAEDSWQQRAQAEDIPQHVKETEGQRDPQKEPRLKRFALISCIVALLVFLIQTLLLFLWFFNIFDDNR
jgi:hypothetical protein